MAEWTIRVIKDIEKWDKEVEFSKIGKERILEEEKIEKEGQLADVGPLEEE